MDLEEAAVAAVELRNKGCMNAAVVVAENAAAIFIAVLLLLPPQNYCFSQIMKRTGWSEIAILSKSKI